MESGVPLNDHLRLYFVDLTIWKTLSLQTRNRLAKWLVYLSSNQEQQEAFGEAFENDALIQRALVAEALFFSNRTHMAYYEARELRIWDRNSTWTAEWRRGWQQGFEETSGKKLPPREIARTMLVANEPLDKIGLVSGLSPEEIEWMRKRLVEKSADGSQTTETGESAGTNRAIGTGETA